MQFGAFVVGLIVYVCFQSLGAWFLGFGFWSILGLGVLAVVLSQVCYLFVIGVMVGRESSARSSVITDEVEGGRHYGVERPPVETARER